MRAAVLVAASLLPLALAGCSGSSSGAMCSSDALTRRALSDLQQFSDWVRTFGVRGAIGEVGWPGGADATAWNTLAERWYQQAGEMGLPAYAWSAAERWPASYPLAIYRRASAEGAPVVGTQAFVLEHHLGGDGTLGGLSLADGSFGASESDGASYSSSHPGTYGTDYVYPSQDFLQFLRTRGVRHLRLTVTWERLQPVPGGPLDATELGRVRAVLAAAAAAGQDVVLDLHNYGRYATQEGDGPRRVLLLGSPGLPAERLADVWRRLAEALHGGPGLAGYGLMDEPHDLPGGAQGWEAASVLATKAVREVDPATPVYVAGYAFSAAATWPAQHPRPWVPVEDGPVVYEAHEYFDVSREGFYSQGYAATDAALAAKGTAGASSRPVCSS